MQGSQRSVYGLNCLHLLGVCVQVIDELVLEFVERPRGVACLMCYGQAAKPRKSAECCVSTCNVS